MASFTVSGAGTLPDNTTPLRGTWTIAIRTSNGVAFDADHSHRAGRQPLETDGQGALSVTLPQTDGSFLYEATFLSKDRNVCLGPYTFDLTTNKYWQDIIETPTIVPVTPTQVTLAQEAQTAAEAAAVDAIAAAAAATAVGTTTDALIAGRIADPASLTKAQLTNAFGVSVPVSLGTGMGDQLAAINTIVQANPGRTITFPAGPTGNAIYEIAGHATGILLDAPGTRLVLEDGATIKVMANALTHYAAVTIQAVDCSVSGGTMVGDVGSHIGTTGEQGFGVLVHEAAHRAKVEGTRFTKFWGDGICIADTTLAYTTGARPADVEINDVVCDDNRRQGISIIAALRCRINGGSFINTGTTAYTAPGAGIGVESNAGGLQKITDLVVTGAVVTRNKGRGLYCNSAGNELTATLNGVRSIDNGGDGFSFDYDAEATLNGCHAHNNGVTAASSVDGFFVASNVTAKIKFSGCTATGNTRMGFTTETDDTTLSACVAWGNGWSGFASATGDRTTLSACESEGNNQISNFYGNIMLDGGADHRLIGCLSRAGTGATKAGWGYQISGTVTGASLVGCDALGAFTAGPYLDQGTGTIALPKPGAVKQTGTPAAATDAATTQALANDLRTKLLALGFIA